MPVNKGQSLFELVIAIAVIGLFLVALVGAVTRSIATSTFSRQKSVANRYVQEGLEWVRHERDLDWTAFYARSSGVGSLYCINDLTFSAGSCAGPIAGTIFLREVVLSSSGIKFM
jgi:type II secretory pathway pseudopilin PulG